MDLRKVKKVSLWTLIATFFTALIGSLVPNIFVQYVAVISLYFVFLPSLVFLTYSTVRLRKEQKSDFSVTLGKNRNPQLFKSEEPKTEQ